MSLFSDNTDRLETSQYESEDEDQLNSDRMAKIREAEALENLRLKSINLNKRLAKRVGSPVGSSEKAQSGSRAPNPVEPVQKKSRKNVKNPVIRPVIAPPDEDLDGNSYLLNSSVEMDDDDNPAAGAPAVDKASPADDYRIPRREKTSSILPEKFWPTDMTAAQIDKFTVDQVHAMKKFELEEKSLRKDADLPGLVIMPTEMTLPEVNVEGGVHDFVKKIVPASMVHFPIGPPEDWWHNLAVEWKTVTGEVFNESLSIVFSSIFNFDLLFRRIWPRGERCGGPGRRGDLVRRA